MTDGPGQERPDPPLPPSYGGQSPPPVPSAPAPTYGTPTYGSPSPAPQGSSGAGPTAGSTKGFLASLFDFDFTSFVATRVVKVLYVLVVVIAALYTLLLLAFGFRLGTGVGLLFLLVIAPLFFVVFVAFYRVLLELMVVIFRMAEDVAEIRRRGGFGTGP